MVLTAADVVMRATPSDRRAALARYDPARWVTEVAKIKLPKSGPVSFDDHPFMLDVYRDLHPEIVVIKGAQTGFSTWAMCRTMWAATQFSLSVLYTFPTGGDVMRFTQARINPMIIGSAYLAERIIEVNSVSLKQFSRVPSEHYRRLRREGVDLGKIGLSTVYFGGAASDKDAQAMDVDLLIHDEEDRSTAAVIDQMSERLSASRLAWRYRLSTPTLPGAGIDRSWSVSDQRLWMHHCSRCGNWFEMEFPEAPGDPRGCIWPETWDPAWGSDSANTAPKGSVWFMCPGCHEPLRDEDRRNGRWEPTFADRYVHGYRVSQMSAPWVSAAQILFKRHKAIDTTHFWNLVMGRPYEEGSNAMTRSVILGAGPGDPGRTNPMRERALASRLPCYLGVDVGAKFDVVVDTIVEGRPVTLNMMRLETIDEVAECMRRYNVLTCVIDGAPEEHLIRRFQESFAPGVVWRQYYGGRELTWAEKTHVVSAPRTEILSKAAEELLTTRELPRWDAHPDYESYVQHHVNSKKVPIWVKGLEHERIVDHYEWHEVGPDHMFHAASNAMLARMRQRSAGVPQIGLVSLRRGVERPAGQALFPRLKDR